MITKLLIAVILILATILAVALTRKVETNNTDDIAIETVGLNDLNIQLESPYGSLSPRHVLLVNNSSHHLLACEIVFEWISQEGQVYPSTRIIAYAGLLKSNLATRQSLLKSHPGIAPHSKMLIGMGVEPDLVPVVNNLPPVGKSTVETVLKDSIKLNKLVIRLDAVVLENGQAAGPKAHEFLIHLRDSVLKEEGHDK